MRARRSCCILGVIAALALTLLPGAAPAGRLAPIVDLPAQPLASSNVSLLGTIPDFGATGARFAGRYLFVTSTGGGILAPGPGGGLRVYDVSNPEVPQLTGYLPLPHWENEDVDVSLERDLVLISMDQQSSRGPVGGALFVVDIISKARPLLRSILEYPVSVGTVKNSQGQDVPIGGPGHIVNCILSCKYAYVTGARNGSIFVIDLRDTAHPQIMGTFLTPAGRGNAAFKTGTVHDVNVDPYGYVWMTGSGGTAVYAPIVDPLHPKLLAAVSPADNAKYDQFIHHNSLRLNRDTVLVTEEDWMQPQCGRNEDDPVLAKGEQGSFQTWHIAQPRLTPLGTWQTELGTYIDGGSAVTIVCSSHWFTFNRHKVVAVGWYNQGVRFLDVSNPRAIRQVGYWMGPLTTASGAYFVPGRPDLAYAVDYTRGIDILRIAGGGAGAPTVQAPVRAEWFAGYSGFRFDAGLKPHPVWGWSCAVGRVGTNA